MLNAVTGVNSHLASFCTVLDDPTHTNSSPTSQVTVWVILNDCLSLTKRLTVRVVALVLNVETVSSRFGMFQSSLGLEGVMSWSRVSWLHTS